MNFVSFVKETGEMLWDTISGSRDQKALTKLKDYIHNLGIPGAENIDISLDPDGTATIAGKIASQELKEKLLVAIGNVAGISTVKDETSVLQNRPDSSYYVVKPGDTLSGISMKVYGNVLGYRRIFEANKPMLIHPDKIYPGQTLVIPPKNTSVP